MISPDRDKENTNVLWKSNNHTACVKGNMEVNSKDGLDWPII